MSIETIGGVIFLAAAFWWAGYHCGRRDERRYQTVARLQDWRWH